MLSLKIDFVASREYHHLWTKIHVIANDDTSRRRRTNDIPCPNPDIVANNQFAIASENGRRIDPHLLPDCRTSPPQ
jgi:hypothetical protein